MDKDTIAGGVKFIRTHNIKDCGYKENSEIRPLPEGRSPSYQNELWAEAIEKLADNA